MAVNRDLIGQADRFDHADRVVLDMDSSESPVHGAQEGSAYNGHFESVGYHPLFLVNDHGDCQAAKLRPGNIASADDWDDLLLPEIERRQAARKRVAFRADAAFARPAIYEALETRGVGYAIRIPANRNLELAVDILFCSPGRPSLKPLVRYKSIQYQADTWTTPRRVVAKVEHRIASNSPRVCVSHEASTRLGVEVCAIEQRPRVRSCDCIWRLGDPAGSVLGFQNGNPGVTSTSSFRSSPVDNRRQPYPGLNTPNPG